MVEDDLLAQIRENPDDDQLRLVYADAVMGRDRELGEYIVMSVLHQRDPLDWDARKSREKAWAAALGFGEATVLWWRGLPLRIMGTAEEVLSCIESIARYPVRRLDLAVTPATEQLVERSELSVIEELEIEPPTDDYGKALSIERRSFEALCRCRHLHRLRVMKFGHHAKLARLADVLSGAPWLSSLESLTLDDLDEDATCRILLVGFPNLRSLDLRSSQVGDLAATAFSRAWLPKLVELGFHYAFDGAHIPTALGPHASKLRALSLTAPSLRHLILPAMPGLHELYVSGGLGNSELRSLVDGEWLALTRLGLPRNEIDDAGVIELARAAFPALTQLDLNNNRFGKAGALALAHRTGLPALRTLELGSVETGEVITDRYVTPEGWESHAEPVMHTEEEVQRWFEGSGLTVSC